VNVQQARSVDTVWMVTQTSESYVDAGSVGRSVWTFVRLAPGTEREDVGVKGAESRVDGVQRRSVSTVSCLTRPWQGCWWYDCHERRATIVTKHALWSPTIVRRPGAILPFSACLDRWKCEPGIGADELVSGFFRCMRYKSLIMVKE